MCVEEFDEMQQLMVAKEGGKAGAGDDINIVAQMYVKPKNDLG